jgi:hypothetical protein
VPDYPPYVDAYGGISKLFQGIKRASVPPKFSQDFMGNTLGLKSSSYRALIPLLKRLGFIDQANVPTQAYRDFRDDSRSGQVMAAQVRSAYDRLFSADERAHKLSKPEVMAKLKTLTGAAEKDITLPKVAATFLELAKLSKFDSAPLTPVKPEEPDSLPPRSADDLTTRLGISYTINLNLPATTEVEVFNAIFKSLKEHILSSK